MEKQAARGRAGRLSPANLLRYARRALRRESTLYAGGTDRRDHVVIGRPGLHSGVVVSGTWNKRWRYLSVRPTLLRPTIDTVARYAGDAWRPVEGYIVRSRAGAGKWEG